MDFLPRDALASSLIFLSFFAPDSHLFTRHFQKTIIESSAVKPSIGHVGVKSHKGGWRSGGGGGGCFHSLLY